MAARAVKKRLFALDAEPAMGVTQLRDVTPVTVCELFCADAYYSFVVRRFGADRCDAFDSDRDGFLVQAHFVAKLLNEEKNIGIHKVGIFDMSPDYRASIVLSVGGLYRVADPLRAIEMSYGMAEHYLIIQTVVTLTTEDEKFRNFMASDLP